MQENKIKDLIKNIVEPKIEEVIIEFNKAIEKHGFLVGASVEWFIKNKEKDDNEKID